MASTRSRSQLAAYTVAQRVARCPLRKTIASGCCVTKPRNRTRDLGVGKAPCAKATQQASKPVSKGGVTTKAKTTAKSRPISKPKSKMQTATANPVLKAKIGRIASAVGCADLKFSNDVLQALQKTPEATLKGVVEQLSLIVQHAGRKVVKEEDVALLRIMSSSLW